mgnify:CR=1 FL=1
MPAPNKIKTIARIKAYEDAGADVIFPEAMKDEKEFEKIRKNTKISLLANMTEFGKSKLLNYKDLENLGYNIVIYPVTTQRLAMKNVEDGLRAFEQEKARERRICSQILAELKMLKLSMKTLITSEDTAEVLQAKKNIKLIIYI